MRNPCSSPNLLTANLHNSTAVNALAFDLKTACIEGDDAKVYLCEGGMACQHAIITWPACFPEICSVLPETHLALRIMQRGFRCQQESMSLNNIH